MAKLVAVDDIPKGARLVAVEDSKPAGEQLNDLIGDVSVKNIKRQLGLTARYGLEGLASIPQMLLGGPMEALGIKGAGSNVGTSVSDYVGLPKPETTQEKVVGEGAKLLAPTGGFIKAGQFLSGGYRPFAQQLAVDLKKAQSASDVASKTGTAAGVGNVLKANPVAQVASAVGAGTSGEYVKETGGTPASQFVASLAGGLAAPSALSLAKNAPSAAMNSAKRIVEAVAPGVVRPATTNIDITIQNVLRDSGVNMADIPAGVLNGLRADVAQAQKLGNLSNDAIRRLADYRLVGATPNRGNLTLNPVQLTQEKNLAKVGVSSSDPQLQSLGMRVNDNEKAIIERLNQLGANTADDSIGAATKVTDALNRTNSGAQSVINNLYSKARDSAGRDIELNRSHFANTVDEMLARENKNNFLPPEIRNQINDFALGQQKINGKIYDTPFNVNTADAFKTDLATAQRAATDGNVKRALSIVRDAIDSTPAASDIGTEAMRNFDRARRVNRAWMGVVERTPALQAVRDGVEPDKFVNNFIIGNGNGASVASVAQLKNTVRNSPEALQAIRGQILSHIKEKALSGGADEVGKISQSAMNKAINAIGERKLKMFFTSQEIAEIKALGRVASYEQVQPAGSAVNNSNTSGAMVGSLLSKLAGMPLLNKIPMGREIIGQPLINISNGIGANQAMNIPSSLIMPMGKQPSMLPSLVVPGLLATQN